VIFGFQSGVEFFTIDVIVTREVRIDQDNLLLLSQFTKRVGYIAMEELHDLFYHSFDMSLVLNPGDLNLSGVKQLHMNLLERGTQLKPVNEHKAIIEGTLLALFHAKNVLLTDTNVHLSNVFEHDPTIWTIDLVKDRHLMVDLDFLDVFLKDLYFASGGEVELDLLLDDALAIRIVLNHGQPPKQSK
jgi:hypothetical protein